MENLTIKHATQRALGGTCKQVLVGVVASGNLEVFARRSDEPKHCAVELITSVTGFDETWRAVIADFVERISPGGVRFILHDGGARPDTVMLRLMQAARALETTP